MAKLCKIVPLIILNIYNTFMVLYFRFFYAFRHLNRVIIIKERAMIFFFKSPFVFYKKKKKKKKNVGELLL